MQYSATYEEKVLLKHACQAKPRHYIFLDFCEVCDIYQQKVYDLV